MDAAPVNTFLLIIVPAAPREAAQIIPWGLPAAQTRNVTVRVLVWIALTLREQ